MFLDSTEEHADKLKTSRIYSSDLCFLSGGVTGESAMAIVQRKRKHKEAQAVEQAAKRKKKEDKEEV